MVSTFNVYWSSVDTVQKDMLSHKQAEFLSCSDTSFLQGGSCPSDYSTLVVTASNANVNPGSPTAMRTTGSHLNSDYKGDLEGSMAESIFALCHEVTGQGVLCLVATGQQAMG